MLVFNTFKGEGIENQLGLFGRSFNQRSSNKAEKLFAKNFNELLYAGLDGESAYENAKNLMGSDFDKLSEDFKKVAESAKITGTSITQVGTAAKASSLGVKVLSAALNMLTTLAVTMAITGIVKGIEYLATAQQRLDDAAQSARENFEQENDSLDSLNSELENTRKLMADLEGRELTMVEEDEYNRLKQTNDELEREIKLQEARVRIAEKEARKTAVNANAQKQGSSTTGGIISQGYVNQDLVRAALGTEGFDASKYGTTNAMLAATPDYSFIYSDYIQFNADMLPTLKQQQLEVQKAYKDAADKAIKSNMEVSESELEALDALKLKAEETESLYDNVFTTISDRIDYLDTQIGDLSRVKNPTSDTDKAFNAMFDERDMLSALQNSVIDAEAQFVSDTVLQKFAEDAEKIKNIIQSTGEISTDQLATGFGNVIHAFEEYGWSVEDVVRHLNELYAAGDKPKASLDSLYSSLFKNTEAYTKLTEAMNEQNEAGALSFETYTALIEANSEFAELLTLTAEGYVLNTEAVWEYVEAQDEFNKLKAMVELEKINEQLLNSADLSRDEVDALMAQKAGWEQVITSITSATGALQAWKQAQASANEDAAFNEGESMYDTITEGLKTGKVGTDDFQRSIDFMLGENWLRDYRGDKDAAYKAAQQKAKRYFGQEDERIGMENFMQDLADNGFAEYNGEDFKLLEDVNIEGIADKLGMSFDAIKSMFGLMETYGAELEYAVDTSELTDQDRKLVENANSIEEIRKAQAEVTAEIEHQQSILSDTSATEAQKQAAQEEINNLNTANEVLEEKKGILEGVEGAAQALTLDEALSKITELQTAINTLVEAGIDVPVEITGQYDELTTLISQLGGQAVGANGEVQGFVLHVSDPDDAAGKIKALQEAIAAVQANPNIEANLKAEFVGAAQTAISSMQEVINSNGTDVTIHLVPDDQATTAIDGVATGPEGGWNATITAKAETDDANIALTNFVEKERTACIKIEYEPGEHELDLNGTGSKQLDDPENLISANRHQMGKHQLELDGSGWKQTGQVLPSPDELSGLDLSMTPEQLQEIKLKMGLDKNSVDDVADDATNVVQNKVDSNPPKMPVDINQQQIQEGIQEEVEVDPISVPVEPEIQQMPSGGEMGIPSQTEISVGADTSTGQAQVDALKTSAGTPVQTPVSLDTSTADSQNSSLVSRLRQTVTKTVRIVYTGIRSKFATGTKNAPGGLSLVDDGTGSNAGPELIVHNKQGTYELGSGDSPRVTHLDKGDTVYTAKQTKSILAKAAKIGGFFRDGLNNARTIIGNAFATGVSGSMSWKKINQVLSGSGTSNKNTSSSKSSTKTSNWEKYAEKLFDWIEIRLERLQVQTEKWMLAASEAIGYAAKNAELDKALRSTTQQIEETTQAYQRYLEQADIIATKTKLTADVIKNIQEGTIDIASYDDGMQKKIKEYQEWWDKSQSCIESLTELREQERELATQKLDSILDHYQWRIDRLDAVVSNNDAMIGLKAATGIRIEESDYTDSIDATNQKIKELIISRVKLAKEFEDMIQRGYIVEGSELWYEYTGELENLDETIIETKTDLQELVDASNKITLTNLQYALTALEASANAIHDMMSLHEAQGVDASDGDYKSLVENGMAQIKNLEAQNAELIEQQKMLDPLSEKYQEIQEQIDSNNQSIMDMKVSQEQWNDAAIDLEITKLQEYKEELSKANDEYQRQKELQQAIEDLERARSQRTQRVFKEGQGFVFEADQEAVLDAQKNLENVIQNQLLSKMDDLIEALEDSKKDTNVYDANGVLLGEEYTLPVIGDYTDLLNNYKASNDVVSSAMEDARKMAYEQVLKGVTSNSSVKSIQIGDIVVQGVDNAEDLAAAIIDNFPNALLQELYK